MINEEPTMSAGTGGFSGSADATGPNAGFDPKLDFRKRANKKIKDQPFVSAYRKLRKNWKEGHTPNDGKVKNKVNPAMPSRLLQYKLKVPGVGETIVYASNVGELRQKMRLLINPRYRGDVEIDRVFPGEAQKFYYDKRMKAMKNIPEEFVLEDQDKQVKQQLAQQKVQNLKKNADLKKQEIQKTLQKKTANLKRKARVGTDVSTQNEEFSKSGNLAKIKHCAENGCAGAIKFHDGTEVDVTPDVAKKVMSAFSSLSARKNQAKFSNATNESPDMFNRVLAFSNPAETDG
tara:strand:+ start:507 stop:1376 length:870 start_codon:yes stop_codon:yes gene_type:complete